MGNNRLVATYQLQFQLLLCLGAILCGLIIVWLFVQYLRIGLLLAAGIAVLVLGILLFFGLSGTFLLKRVLYSLFVVAILFPYIRLPGDIPDVRPEFIVILVAWGFLFINHLAAGKTIRFRRCFVYKWFLLFGLCIITSMVYAAVVKGQPIMWRDFWEPGKLFLYFLIFVLIANLQLESKDVRRYYKFALIVLALSAIFGFLQYVDFGGINNVIIPHYAPTQIHGLLTHRRIVGTFGNPNEFGALMVLAASLSISGALFMKDRKLRMLCWSTLPIFTLALLLTLSRSSLIAFFTMVIVVFFLFIHEKRLNRKLKRILIFMFFGYVIGAFLLQVMPQKAYLRFGELKRFNQATSWKGRVENWENHFAIWKESPWLGWGPGKATMGTIVDNEWLLLLRRYGVIGICVFIGLYWTFFRGLSQIRKRATEPSVVALCVALQGTLVGYTLYMVPAAVYHCMQLMSILLIFLGLAYSQRRLI